MAQPDKAWQSAMAPLRTVGLHQSVDVTTVEDLTPPAGADQALVQAVGGNVRFTLDGETDPTTSTGFQLRDGDGPLLIALAPAETGNIVIKAIGEDASAVLEVQWGR